MGSGEAKRRLFASPRTNLEKRGPNQPLKLIIWTSTLLRSDAQVACEPSDGQRRTGKNAQIHHSCWGVLFSVPSYIAHTRRHRTRGLHLTVRSSEIRGPTTVRSLSLVTSPICCDYQVLALAVTRAMWTSNRLALCGAHHGPHFTGDPQCTLSQHLTAPFHNTVD